MVLILSFLVFDNRVNDPDPFLLDARKPTDNEVSMFLFVEPPSLSWTRDGGRSGGPSRRALQWSLVTNTAIYRAGEHATMPSFCLHPRVTEGPGLR